MVTGRLHVDVGVLLGIRTDGRDGLLTALWKAVGRFAVRRVGWATIQLDQIAIYSGFDGDSAAEPGSAPRESEPLLKLALQPKTLMLHVDPFPTFFHSPLASESLIVTAQPTLNITRLLDFAQRSWRNGHARLRLDI